MKHGVLIDLRAIQGYIFASNRLKDNIGASFLVSHIFDDVDAKDKVIGGGNMLCFCDSEAEAQQIIRDLSEKVLSECPGLSFNAVYEAQGDMDMKELISNLWDKLQKEKQARWQQTIIPSFGINAQCSSSIYAAEYMEKEKGKDILVSSVVKAKRDASPRANVKIDESYQSILEHIEGKRFEFTDDFASLGTLKGEESYLAIVHIDGDDMGKKFAECTDFEAYKTLSQRVDTVFGKAFEYLVQYTVDQVSAGEWTHYQKRLKKEDGRFYLPLRPIFIGGDDVTFVCEARLGITLALEYIKKVRELSGGDFSCCAGIAIAKERYPFYQSQQMAQALCRSAKNRCKDNGSVEPYLDYQLLDSSTTDPLEMIRSRYHLPGGRVLYMKPYSIQRMEAQMANAKDLSDPDNWPRSKVKEMRDVLFGTREEIIAFEEQIEARGGLKLPKRGFSESESQLVSPENIYPDMIELMDLIPTGGE